MIWRLCLGGITWLFRTYVYMYCVDINTIVVYRICEIQNTAQFTIRGSVRQYILVQDFIASDERISPLRTVQYH